MKKIIAIAIAAFSMQVYAEIKGIPATEKDCSFVGSIAKFSAQFIRAGYSKEQAWATVQEASAQAADRPVYLRQAFEIGWGISSIRTELSVDETRDLAKFACLRKAGAQ